MADDDDRKNMFLYLFAILRAKRPSIFLFENVREILTAKNGDGSKFFDVLIPNFADCGYCVMPMLLNSSDFGSPQQRKRVYFLGVRMAIIYGDTPSGHARQQDKLYSKLGLCPTLTTLSTPAFDADEGWRILTPRECARLQRFPDTFVLPERDNAAYRQVGNAVTVDVVSAILWKIIGKM